MEQYTSRLIRKQRKPENRVASSDDHSEQVRELKELQRSLAERIRQIQLGAEHNQAGKTA